MSKHTEDPKDWLIKRNRHGTDHIDACDYGFRTQSLCQIHHILCVHACSDTNIPESAIEYVHKCLAITDWDINAAPNCIGLPIKPAYVGHPIAPDRKTATAGWDGWPCHQVDHNIYLKEVEKWVTQQIWNKLRAAAEGKKCEEVKGENIKARFESGSAKWRGWLTRRGESKKGTQYCLENCWDLPDDAWYVPFSMSPLDPIPSRVRPPRAKLAKLEGLLAMIS